MLCELHIQDIVLIEQLSLPVARGLTALTGETGAGKSILLDSLGLAMGGKADKGLVRHGASRGIVAATFDVAEDHPAWALLEANGLATEDDTLTLRRVQMADGKSRAFVNDQAVSVGLLREVGATLIEIHGQHSAYGFLNPGTHLALLDEYAGLGETVTALRALWARRRAIEKELAERRAERDRLMREADYFRHVAEELTALMPEEGEEARLAERRASLMAAEKVTADLRDATQTLEDDTAQRRLAHAAAQIERAAGRLADEEAGPLREAVARLDTAMEEFAAARDAVVAAADGFVMDPEELEAAEERLFALRAAARKVSQPPDRLPAYLAEITAALDRFDEDETAFRVLEEDLGRAISAYEEAAAKVSAARASAADRLDKAVMKELKPLKLGTARFQATVGADKARPGPDGIDDVQFLVSTNPGAPFGPLSSIASGGELSRFVLALKATLVAEEGRTVIIFDEVDSGVGGAVADAVGERLSRIADGSQVLVVTHSPQVAARGTTHWKVAKSGRAKAVTSVTPLDETARVEELARMLSGATVTDEARAAAKSLLSQNARKRRAA